MASRREKLIEGARPYLEEGEQTRYAASGRRRTDLVHPFAEVDAKEIASLTAC